LAAFGTTVRGMTRATRPRSAARLFGAYAAVTLVPVLVLGAVLASTFRSEARRRGVAEGQAEAALVAHTAVEPLLDGHSLNAGITAVERADLSALVANRSAGTILRMRLRDLSGRVVFSDDGSGFADKPEADALEAAHGAVITLLTRLNTDSNDTGPRGVAAVEAYRPVMDVAQRPLGVLEIYLPYAPINHDVTAGLRTLYLVLGLGLAALYLMMFGIAWSVGRGLRRQVALNVFRAEHDSLTDLPNRTLFHRRAAAAINAARPGAPAIIAIVDLDRFKEVNDSLGHHNGDRLLSALASRLADHMRTDDTVARLGGDEFGIILRDATDAEGALRRVRDVIDREVEVSGLPISVEASIGFVISPDDGAQVDDLLQRADVAMYLAKTQHLGVVRYDAAQDHYDAANLGLVAQLRHAIDEGQLVLHYQPQTTLLDGRVEAVEALVRWQHPVHGLLGPDRFLPLAEQTDLIDTLTHWVLTRAITDLRALGDVGVGLSVAVNVSARSLARADFARRVLSVLEDQDVPPKRLIVEITETALLTDPARAATILAELDRAGVRVSLDDFGCGQTSLGYLSSLPVHELKIDKSFIGDMLLNQSHAAIVRSIVDLGHNLALRVIGEGVESPDVLASLKASGCDVAQGFLLGCPMPIDQLHGWLLADRSFGAVGDRANGADALATIEVLLAG
jgi:diguanylate cyclase (GGDEF)-like protein